MNRYSFLAGAAMLLAAGPSHAQSALTQAQAKEILEPFYAIFTMPVAGDVKGLLEQSTTSDWQSCSSETTCYSREQRLPVFRGFGDALPDLKYVMKEIFVSGDTVFVRGEMSGTPVGTFLGVPHSGRSFTIMTIDEHKIKDGRVARTNHIEDWASAARQLSQK